MKRYIIAIAVIAGFVYADTAQNSKSIPQIETLGTVGSGVSTQYFGNVVTTENTVASEKKTTDAVWKIVRIIYDTNGQPTSIKEARPTGGRLYGNVWTNRVAATYQ